jgi:hypothetical protein
MRTRKLNTTRWSVIAVAVGAVLATTLATPPVSGAGGAAPAASPPSSADAAVLNDWNLRAQGITTTLRPTAHGQARGMAMVQGAVYDAVNAIDRGYQPYLLDVEALDVDADASYSAAIATAAHDVLVSIAPSQEGSLDTALEATLAGIGDGFSEDEGVRAGEEAAAAMLDARDGDGFNAAFDFTGHTGTGPGQWNPTTLDPDAWVANLRPFLIESNDQFRSDGPNALDSAAYTEDYNEVKTLGSKTSSVRTADQTTAAIFWQFAPIALWNRMVRDLSGPQHLDTLEEARLLAMINLAAVDGAIACWNDKYYWNFWRPVSAIRAGDNDLNDDTVGDPTWTPLFDPSTPVTGAALANPPFPDHPSGHGCVSGAVLNTVKGFLHSDRMELSIHSGRFPNQPREFSSLSEVMREIIDARVWGGIHFRTADVQGAVMGKKVAHWQDRHYFNPVK